MSLEEKPNSELSIKPIKKRSVTAENIMHVQEEEFKEKPGPKLEEPQCFNVDFEMTFRDTGYGISEEAQKDLFLDFTTLDENHDKNKKGVGLGLSICKDLVLAFGGTINVKSKLNSGTDFIIGVSTTSKITQKELKIASREKSSGKISRQSNKSRIDLRINFSADLGEFVKEDQMFLSSHPKKSNS